MERKQYSKAVKCLGEMVRAVDNPVKVAFPANAINKGCCYVEGIYIKTVRTRCQVLAIVMEDDEQGWGHSGNRSCSAGLCGLHRVTGIKPLVSAIVSLTQQHGHTQLGALSKEETEFFYDWYLHRSPYASIISTKSVKTAMEKGIIYNADTPSNFLVSALIAQRVAWERTNIVVSMKHFVEAGMNENAAFVLAHIQKFDGNVLTDSSTTGHVALGAEQMTDKYLLNFCTETLAKPEEHYSVMKTYNHINDLWGVDAAGSCYELPHRAIDEYCARNNVKDGGVAAVVIPNPFAESMMLNNDNFDRRGLSEAQCVQALVEYTNNLLGVGHE